MEAKPRPTNGKQDNGALALHGEERLMSLEDNRKYAVLFVCTGNICRSPTAHGVLLQQLEQAGLAGRVWVDAAGRLRIKGSAPTSEADGTIVGSQT